MPSEYKRLLETIEAERLACWRGLNGLASVARHEFILAKDNSIAACRNRLVELIGDEKVVDQVVHDIVECADMLYEAEKWRTESLELEQLEHSTPTTFQKPMHTRLHKKPHDNAKIGDILIYKLKPYDQPVEPDRLWHGRILTILTDRYNKRDYLVENLEMPEDFADFEKREMVYSSQVYGYEPATSKPDSQTVAEDEPDKS